MNKSLVFKGFGSFLAAIFIVGTFFAPVGSALADDTNGSLSGNTVALGVTQITPVQTFATADGNYADGWKWTFSVNVPANETVLQMKFADWTGTAGVIPVSNNMQFYSAQSTNAANEANAISIVASGTYSASMYLNPTQDLDTNQAGRQIQITVEARVPAGSGGGAYSTSYGINTNPDPAQNGQVTVTPDANTPHGNIAVGQSQVTLAKFDMYATVEAVRVKYLDFEIDLANATKALSSELGNIVLVDDTGTQIGSTITLSPTNNACATNGAASYSTSTQVYQDCFGTADSPINYVVPANTTRVLSLKADVQSTADFSTLIAKLNGDSGNLQGLTSSQIASSSAATGSMLTLSGPSVIASINNALGSQKVSSGVTNQRIGSYTFTTSAAEGVNVNNLTIQVDSSNFQNVKVLVGGAQFGTTQGVVSSGTQYTFSGTPFTIPAGSAKNIDVYADTLSNATTAVSPATVLTGFSGAGQVSFASIGLTGGSVNGQDLSFASGPTISVTADSGQTPAGQIVMGSVGDPLATFRFTETSNVENVKITDLKVLEVVASTATVKPAFSNVTLWNGSTNLGSAGSAVAAASGTAYIYSFHFGTPVIVPQANSVSLVLKGDAASYASSGATDNSTSSFQVTTGYDSTTATSSQVVTALGATSNKVAMVTTPTAIGNTQTILRSGLTFSATPLGATSGRGKVSSDQLVTLSFTANAAGPVTVNTVTVSFSGTAASTTFADTLSAVRLLDENNESIGSAATATYSNGNLAWVFSLGSGANGEAVSAGTTRNWTLVVDDTKLLAAGGQNSVNLIATINANADIKYTDGLDNAASTNLSLPFSVLTPIQLNSVVFSQGI